MRSVALGRVSARQSGERSSPPARRASRSRCTSGQPAEAARPSTPERLAQPAPEVEAIDVADDQAVAKGERRVDRDSRRAGPSPRTCRSRPSARGRWIGVGVDVRRDHGEILAARAQHPPHRRDAGGVERREHRIGERRVRRIAGDHRRARRGARARRRSARSAPRSDAARRRHQSVICCVSALDRSLAVMSTIGITRS